MDNKSIIKIEKVKSLFNLAQIIIILAGFMFTTAGVLYSNYQMINVEGITSCKNPFMKYEIFSGNISSELWEELSTECNEVFSQKGTHLRNWTVITFSAGIISTIISLIIYWKGYQKFK